MWLKEGMMFAPELPDDKPTWLSVRSSKVSRCCPSECKEQMDRCLWSEQFDGEYETACGKAFALNDGTPAENGMKFCCFCGKPLQDVPFEFDDLED